MQLWLRCSTRALSSGCLPKDLLFFSLQNFRPINHNRQFLKGLEVFGFFFPLCFFFDSPVLSVSLAICSIFGAGNCHLNGILQHFGVRTSRFPWYLQHFGAQPIHVAWYFATGIHLSSIGLGLVFGWLFFLVGFRFSLGWLWNWFRVGLGLV